MTQLWREDDYNGGSGGEGGPHVLVCKSVSDNGS